VSDDISNQARQNYSRQLAAEYAEINTPRARAQAELDRWWQAKLDARARARRSEVPEVGEYDPMKRFEAEMDYQQEQADWRYTRGR
jgi:hypothetical protein